MGPLSGRTSAGEPASIHRSVSRANNNRPATAATESWNPRSNATGGDATKAHITASERPDSASARRFETPAAATTPHMSHERIADGAAPVKRT